MHVYHLLKGTNTEIERSFLKSNIKVESNFLWILIGKKKKNDACCLGHLRSVGGSDFIPCKSLLKERSHISPHVIHVVQ